MLGVALLAAGTSLLAFSASVTALALRVRGAAFPLAALVVAAAIVVLTTELLSLVHALQAGWMLLAQAVVAVSAAVVWQLNGRPPPQLPRRRTRAEASRLLRENPLMTATAGVALAALALQAVMAVAVIPNNWDSMTYHLARIGYWLQYDTVLHFANGTARQLGQPPNGEFLQMWPMLFGASERLAPLAQWISAAALWGAIALGARVLGFSKPASVFAGAVFVLLPQPLMQATSTQNDLLVSLFVVATAVLASRGIRDRHPGEITVAALSLGIALGAKGTALLTLPVLGLLVGGCLLRWRPPKRLVVTGLATTLASCILLGALNYGLNQDTYGDPLGGLSTAVERTSPLTDNALRVSWAFADSPGAQIGVLDNVAGGRMLALFGDLKTSDFPGYTFDTTVSEDTSAYGLAGLLVFLPLLIVVLVAPRSSRARRLTAFAALAYLVLFAVLNEANPWVARIMMPGVALGAPLLALLDRRQALGWIAFTLLLVGALPSALANQQKSLSPTPGTPTVLSQNSIQQRAAIRPEMAEPLTRLASELPGDADLGLVRGDDSWDFAFRGHDTGRRVEPLEPEQATQAMMRERDLDGIVFADVDPPRRLGLERIGGNYWLLKANAATRRGTRP